MKVHFTPALKRFVPNLDSIELQGNTVADVIRNIELACPGLTDYFRHALAVNGATLASAVPPAICSSVKTAAKAGSA